MGSINSFKSWLLVIRLVSWQLCFISSNSHSETLALTFRSALSRYLQIFQIFKEFIVSSISLEKVVIIIKFLIAIFLTRCYCRREKQNHCIMSALFCRRDLCCHLKILKIFSNIYALLFIFSKLQATEKAQSSLSIVTVCNVFFSRY